MTLLQDGLIAFLSAVGLTALVLPLRGEALAMEADVRELRRLQSRLPGARMVLVDCGLTEDARGLAQYLADREKRGELVDAAEFHLG